MKKIDIAALGQVFINARTHSVWRDELVSNDILYELYELLKWGPTSANCTPARFRFVRSPEAKAKLLTCLDKGNIEKTKSAPITVIIGHDLEFFEKLPKLFPHVDARSMFVDKQDLIASTAFRNGTLQGAYLILAARALGLDCGPMSGFNNAKIDELFFTKTNIRSNFLCNLGYGDGSKLFPRGPRLEFDEACKIL